MQTRGMILKINVNQKMKTTELNRTVKAKTTGELRTKEQSKQEIRRRNPQNVLSGRWLTRNPMVASAERVWWCAVKVQESA